MSEAGKVDRRRYDEVLKLAENRQYAEAKSLIEELMEEQPDVSAYYLTLSQLQYLLNEKEASVSSVFRAIELDPDNTAAIKLMAERQLTVYNNKDEAKKYYDSIIARGNGVDAITNVALELIRQNQYELAMEYFDEVISQKPDDPVVSYSIAYMSLKSEEYQQAWDNAIFTLGQIKQFNDLYSMTFDLAVEAAEALRERADYHKLLTWFAGELETEFNVKINIGFNTEVFSFTWTVEKQDDKAVYTLEYNKENAGSVYMALQKLVEYHMQAQATGTGEPLEIYLGEENRQAFVHDMDGFIKQALAKGYTDATIGDYIDGLYMAITSQAYLTPTNLFIDNFLHENFADLRPLQFLYMCSEAQKYAESTELNEKDEIFPKKLLSTSKIYFMVSALQLLDFYKVNYVVKYNATEKEYDQAAYFYKEYLSYKNDREPNEEYELVQNWAKDVGWDKYFSITAG